MLFEVAFATPAHETLHKLVTDGRFGERAQHHLEIKMIGGALHPREPGHEFIPAFAVGRLGQRRHPLRRALKDVHLTDFIGDRADDLSRGRSGADNADLAPFQ